MPPIEDALEIPAPPILTIEIEPLIPASVDVEAADIGGSMPHGVIDWFELFIGVAAALFRAELLSNPAIALGVMPADEVSRA